MDGFVDNGLKFGVNYVPSKNWFFSWRDLRLVDVDEDLAAIASLGVDHVRIHLRWDLFQPNNYYVCDALVEKLVGILDLAGKYRLKAEVTVLDGWMSGFWFLPPFVKNANLVTDAKMIDCQKFFLRRLAVAIADHPALMGIDVGNEFNMYGLLINKFSTDEGDRWLAELLGETEKLFRGKINVLGVDHQPWYGDAYFSRRSLSSLGAVTSVHSWVRFTGALDYGVFSEESLSLQEYNVELANAYAVRENRKVWIQEFGISPLWANPNEFGRFVYESMLNATRSDNLFGFTFWCSHDVDRKFVFDEIEYDLGLFDVNNKIKPLGKIYADAVAKIKSGAKPAATEKGRAVVIDETRPFDGWEYAKRFSAGLREGRHVAFVLSSRADDTDYLRRRGITKLVR